MSTFAEIGWSVEGIELDPLLCRIGRERYGAIMREGAFSRSLYAAGSFDLVFSNHVYEHLEDPIGVSCDAHTVLQGGGLLYIAVPTFRHGEPAARRCINSAHNFMFTSVSLGNVLRLAGFEPIAHHYPPGANELWLLARKSTGGRVQIVREPWRRVAAEIATLPAVGALRLALRTGPSLPHLLLNEPRVTLKQALRRIGLAKE